MFFWIPRRDAELRFVTKFGGSQLLRNYHTKKLALRGTRPSPHFAQNGPIAPKIT